ncbi:uncharacterized protein EV420DRAFT_1748999 [Desarmillaria tabescens]|uniref:Uncharacterized protein n=1 Tax=Armillaria tabescens TaxID=1929756 RepID=A0AA39N3S8_ARMTA|nr:uncharacterized protein EV420DRAFT_1748999 [Desarmillaria tabescens]KAK0457126.1 hypothetical protein EV420DRAFT_1748999 [Desarmillaria tabescens]
MDTLSSELKELIVDKCGDDQASLVALRTVSKAFYQRATFNLFRYIHASSIFQFDSLSTIFQEFPALSNFVKYLHITLPPGNENRCGCCDDRLEQLEDTTGDFRQKIDDATLRNNCRRAARGLPLNLLPHLETLHITRSPNGPWSSATVTSLILDNMAICQRTFREILPYLHALTSLSGSRANVRQVLPPLSFSVEEENAYYNTTVGPVDPGPSLEVLDIVNSQIFDFFLDRQARFALQSEEALCPVSQPGACTSSSKVDDNWRADKLLDIFAVPNVTMCASGHDIFGPRNLTWFLACLTSTDSASALTQLSIHIDPESEFPKFFDNIRIWAALDALLTGPRFTRFRALNISLILKDVKSQKSNVEPEEMQTFGDVTRLDILARLPVLSARGMVRCSKRVIVE